MNRTILVAALGVALSASILPVQAQSGEVPFTWRGSVSQGGTVRLSSMKGDIRVEPASGSEIEVRGEIQDSRGRRAPNYEVVQTGDGVTICILIDEARCEDSGVRNRGSYRDRDYAAATLTVRLPRGLRLSASTGNGDVDVRGAGGEVRVSTGNGSVRVDGAASDVQASSGNGALTISGVQGGVRASTGNGRVNVSASRGPIRVSSGNGPVDVAVASMQRDEQVEVSSGNGRITVRVPSDFNGELDLSTGHGGARVDFPITIQGRLQPNTIRGRVGSGEGPRIRLRSGNGELAVVRN